MNDATKINDLLRRDLKYFWHPCSRMKDFEHRPPLVVRSAEGCWLTLADGRRVIDAIGSWWCKNLGHRHPRIVRALSQQLQKFEHAMTADTTSEPLVELCEKLSGLMPGLGHAFFAGDGSCAVEIAMKMSLHSRIIAGERRDLFACLENGYHGETLLSLSVSNIEKFAGVYDAVLPKSSVLKGLPYLHRQQEALWQDCGERWPNIEAQLQLVAESLTAVVVEPILQGANRMRLYSADLLAKLRTWCDHNNVHLIADEIATGFGRTGRTLACEHAGVKPDFLCLAKGLTAGALPLSATLTTDKMFRMFYEQTDKGFYHSHTHSGNALACACALATLQVIEEEGLVERAASLESKLFDRFEHIAATTDGKLTGVRGIGAVIAADWVDAPDGLRTALTQAAIDEGIFLRPIDNTLYWFPPLNVDDDTLDEMTAKTACAIERAYETASRRLVSHSH